MTKVIQMQGDMFTSDARAYLHGVNVFGVMGAGIAKTFRTRYPDMYESYRTECNANLLTPGRTFIWDHMDDSGTTTVIYNAASQDMPGANARLNWLASSVNEALDDADAQCVEKIAMPRVGAGIGGLNWDDVLPILETLAREHDCDLEVWTL